MQSWCECIEKCHGVLLLGCESYSLTWEPYVKVRKNGKSYLPGRKTVCTYAKERNVRDDQKDKKMERGSLEVTANPAGGYSILL